MPQGRLGVLQEQQPHIRTTRQGGVQGLGFWWLGFRGLGAVPVAGFAARVPAATLELKTRPALLVKLVSFSCLSLLSPPSLPPFSLVFVLLPVGKFRPCPPLAAQQRTFLQHTRVTTAVPPSPPPSPGCVAHTHGVHLLLPSGCAWWQQGRPVWQPCC